jgi:hypothetical protein
LVLQINARNVDQPACEKASFFKLKMDLHCSVLYRLATTEFFVSNHSANSFPHEIQNSGNIPKEQAPSTWYHHPFIDHHDFGGLRPTK